MGIKAGAEEDDFFKSETIREASVSVV